MRQPMNAERTVGTDRPRPPAAALVLRIRVRRPRAAASASNRSTGHSALHAKLGIHVRSADLVPGDHVSEHDHQPPVAGFEVVPGVQLLAVVAQRHPHDGLDDAGQENPAPGVTSWSRGGPAAVLGFWLCVHGVRLPVGDVRWR